MATRSRGLSAGFGWLTRGISLAFRHPKPIFGACAILVVAVLIPSLINVPMQFYAMHSGTPLQPSVLFGTTIIGMLAGLFLLPLYSGYLRVIDAAERGLTARVGDVFKPYREGKTLRLVGFGLLALLIYFAALVIVIALTGPAIVPWYMQVIAAQAAHQLPPPIPAGFWITFVSMMVVAFFMMAFYAIALGQVTFREQSIFSSVGDGIVGTLKNVLPLISLVIGLVFAWIGIIICFSIAAIVLVFIGKLVGMWLLVVLLLPLYLALILVMFTTTFGVMYHLWRDVCSDDIVTGTIEPLAA